MKRGSWSSAVVALLLIAGCGTADDGAGATTTTGAPANTTSTPGATIGEGAIGPAIAAPVPWPTKTIYVDLEPNTLFVDFVAPDPSCIAASATATVGRGGAILISLFIDGERDPSQPCPDGADVNQVPIELFEPLAGRPLYTSTAPEEGETGAATEAIADAIIGMPVDDAISTIEDAGLVVRDVTGQEAVEEDYNSARINITVVDGRIDFATVG